MFSLCTNYILNEQNIHTYIENFQDHVSLFLCLLLVGTVLPETGKNKFRNSRAITFFLVRLLLFSQTYFNFSYWHSAIFQIDTYNNGELQDVMQTVAGIVRNVVIKVDSFSSLCISVFTAVLKCLSHNKNLRSLILEPTHCRLEHPPDLT